MKLNYLLDSNFISTSVASPLLQNPGSASHRPNVIGLCGTLNIVHCFNPYITAIVTRPVREVV